MKHTVFDFSDWMLISLVVWLCLLPLLLFVFLPILGTAGAGLLVGSILVLLLVICWLVCGKAAK
jgi:hypothetical protein